MSLSQMALPAELWDEVLDYLYADPRTLLRTALVCRAWVRTSRFHAFDALALSLSHSHMHFISLRTDKPKPQNGPEAAAFRALQLDLLLSSPHETLSVSIRSLEVSDTLAPVRLRPNPANTVVVTATLLQLVPRLILLPHITTLALTELCWPLLRSVGSTVKHLSLSTGAVCLGANLPKLLATMPKLRSLELDGVAGIPFRAKSMQRTADERFTSHLHTLTIRHSSIAFLPWLSLSSTLSLPDLKTLKIDGLVSYELEYLSAYLNCESIASAMEVLELEFLSERVDEQTLAPILAPCSALRSLVVRGADARHLIPQNVSKPAATNLHESLYGAEAPAKPIV
ncbi:hypothetical protein C8F01DRAFT_1260476 [Mycena amicta]|nr:hypothetical protein C8F01DRAFT_1260476 [Mycena amicta]